MRATAYPVHQTEFGHVRFAAHKLDPVAPGRIIRPVPLKVKPGAGDAAKGLFQDFPVVIHDRLRPIQGAVEIPHADVQVLCHFLAMAHGHGTLTAVILLPGRPGGGFPDQAHGRSRIGYQHIKAQGTDNLGNPVKVFFARECHQVWPVSRRLGHQPDTHFGYDAEI